MLETNGTLYRQLKPILRYIDIVSMDMKLPSECGQNFFNDHARFPQVLPEIKLTLK